MIFNLAEFLRLTKHYMQCEINEFSVFSYKFSVFITRQHTLHAIVIQQNLSVCLSMTF